MRNPFRSALSRSWMEVATTKLRGSSKRIRAAVEGLKLWHKWMIGALVCAMTIGSISLVASGSSSKKDGTAGVTSSEEAKSETAAAKAETAHPAASAPGPKEPKERSGERAAGPEKNGEAAKEPAPAAGQEQAFQKAPAATKANAEPVEEEDNVRARAQWFHDQRAYPFKYIPSGALQKAIQQRDAMKLRQRAGTGLQPLSVINFPGDGLWHLMGPQPTNRPFGKVTGGGNSGYPTTSGRVTAIAVDPTDATGNTVYIGGAAGGVWKSTNAATTAVGGPTWTALTDAQPSLAVGSIAIDPNNHLTIYVGTGEDDFNIDGYYGAGILKSMDGGNTWAQLGASIFAVSQSPFVGGAQVGAIAVQPGNSNVVLAAVDFFDGNDPKGGVYQSLDGGATWHRPTTGAQGAAGTGLVFDPTSVLSATGATVYAALGDPSSGVTNNGVWKSTDSGANWTKLAGGLPTANVGRITLGYAASTAGASATVYAAIEDTSTATSNLLGLFKTSNAGTAWTQLTNTPAFCNPQCFYDIAVGVSATDPNVVVVGGGAFTDNFTSLFETTDGGTTWTGSGAAANDFSGPAAGTHPHVDTHAIVFTPKGTTSRLYVGNDGGVWRTDNPLPAGVSPTWVDLNPQLAITQFYPGPSAGIADENYGFGGTQDNDTELFSGTLDWTGVQACGDGGFTAIDTQTPTTVYTTCAPGSGPGLVAQSVFNGAVLAGPTPSFVAADNGIAGSGDQSEFIPPLTIDENNPTTLYYGTCRIWQTFNSAASWNAITGDLASGTNTLGAPCSGTGNITTMDVPQKTSNIVFAGTSNGTVWRTGPITSWTEIDNLVPGQLPKRHVTAVRGKRGDTTGNIAYVAFSGFGSCAGCDGKGHVFKTINGGTAWTDISGDLPDAPVNDIIVDHQGTPTHDALYIATDVGVFSCENPEAAINTCSNWTVIGDGLPNSPVLGLAMRRSSRILRAATHGRSMWQIQLTDVQPPAVASLSSLTPAAVMVGAGTTAVTVTGVNFSPSTKVLIFGSSTGITTTFVNTTQLNVSLSSNLFTDGIVYPVTLSDPAGADTGSLPFTVMNPIVSPATLSPGSGFTYVALPMHFTGTGFVPSTIVTFSDTSDNPLFTVSGGTPSAGGTVFDITVPAVDLTTPATYHVSLSNPLPGGGGVNGFFVFTLTQNPNALAIFNPTTIIMGPTALGATSTPVTNVTITNPGGANLTIAANGEAIAGTNGTLASNFAFATPTSGVSCGFPSATTVTVTANGGTCTFAMTFSPDVPPGLVTRTGTLTLTDNGVGNPQVVQIIGLVPQPNTPLAILTPNPVNFGPVPIGTTSPTMIVTMTSIGTSPVNVTSAGFTISGGSNPADFHLLSASGMNPACPLPPTTFTLAPPTFPASACDVGVNFSPTAPPSIETSTLSVADNVTAIPQNTGLVGSGVEITSISPSVVATGGPAFTLTVNGGGFAPSAVVNVGPNGTNPRLTTFVSATQLLASIPASDITTAGSLAISVTTPVPGGTASEPKTLIVAQAEPATNDNVNFATNTSTTPFRITQDTTQATTQLTAFTGPPATPIDPTPGCGGGGRGKSVWFQFKAPATGRVVADTRFSSYATILSAWTISAALPSSTATFTSVACANGNVPASGAQLAESLVGFGVNSGTTYYLMVTDPAGVGGTLTFSLDFASAAPANDAFTNAINASPTPFANTVNSIEATINTGGADPTPSCAPAGAASGGIANSVWYKFTAPSAGTVTADTLTSPYETILTAVTGAPGSFTQVACNASASAGIAQSQVSFAATSGTQYFFMVSAVLGDGGTTNFHLTFTAGGVGAATKLAFITQPSNVAAGAGISPSVQVAVQDASGNTVTTATTSITIAIGTNPSGGALSGTLTQSAVAGIATFPGLTINKTGTGYTLTAAGGGLTGATSTAFNVTAGAATQLAFTVQPSNVGAGAAITPSVQVSVEDAQGNVVTSATTSITLAIGTNPSGGALSGTLTQSAVAGIATFPGLSINKAGTGYTLTAGGGGLTGGTSSAFNVAAGAATKLAFTVQPTNVGAGSAITPSVQVSVEDAVGNLVTSATTSITLAIGTNPSSGTLSGTATQAAVAGVATFPGLSINKAGTGYTLTAGGGGLTGATSSAFNVTSGTAARLAFTVQPSNVGAGSSITPSVQVSVQDAQGNVVTGATTSITLAIGTNPSGGVLSGTATQAAVAGIAAFPGLSINNTGVGYTLTAGGGGLTGATSSAFNVTSGTATKLAFTVQPTNTAGGAAITPSVVVTVQDAQGNTVTTATTSITLAIGTNPSGGALSGTATQAAVAGVATFPGLSINKAGTGYTLTAAGGGLTGATSSAFKVTAGAATKLAFTVQPSNAAAGAAITPSVQVTVQDAQGNTVTSATTSITIAVGTNPSGGTLSGTATQSAVVGVATFPGLSINKAGTGYTLTAGGGGLTGATSSAFNVTAGAATQLAFTVQPTNVAAGAVISPSVQVTVEDALGNVVTGATTSITVAIGNNPSGGTLSGTATQAAMGGVATFPGLSINKTGTAYTLTANGGGLAVATSSAFNVTAGAATKLAFTVQPSNVGAGSAITPSVQVSVEDAQGNVVASATTSITLAIGTNPSGGGLSGTATQPAVAGVATFPGLSINKAGNGYTLTAGGGGLTGATSSAFNVTSGTATKLAFTVQPSNVGAGSSITPAVQVSVEDAQGNVVTGATTSITLAIGTNPSGGTLSGTATQSAAAGVATFPGLSINNVGVGYTLTAAGGGLSGATSTAFNVTSGTPAKLAFTVQPTNTAAGAAITPSVAVTVEDAQGNTVTTATTSITIAIGTNPSGGTLSGTATASAVAGVATFPGLSINKIGNGYTLAASGGGLTGATSSAFNVTAGASTKLAFTVQPTNVGAGSSITPAVQVTVQDAQGNTVTNATTSITVAIGTNPSGGALSGTVTQAAVAGVATFPGLNINKAGTGYTLTASGGGLTGATSSAFNVTAGAAASLTTSAGTPQSVAINAAFPTNLQVSVTDGLGNGVSGVLVTFTINPAANGASGTFSGTNTATTNAQGLATANTFTANGTSGTYTVVASATGIVGTATFTLTNLAGAPASITAISGTPQAVNLNTAFATLKVLVKDVDGNPVSGAAVTFTAPSSGASGTFANGTNTVIANTDATGTASVTTFTANFTNGAYVVNATVAGVAAPAPFSLTNTAAAPTITSLSPTGATAGGAAFVLTVNGTNFATTSVVSFNGVGKTTTFVSSTQLTAAITAADIVTAATVNVSVTTPGPGGGSTVSLPFNINNPLPATTSLVPNSATAGGAGFVLTVNGTNFVTASQVSFNNGLKPTTFKSATQLTATITAADILNAGIVNVTVTNPGPGGGTSTPVAQFTINNAQPALASLVPASTLAGGPAFQLTINGSGFASGATVTFNEANPAKSFSPVATFVNSGKITAAITAPEITSADTFNVTVTNPPPSIGPSLALTFTVNNPVPTLTTLGQTHGAGGTAFNLTVNGTNFVATSVVMFGTKAEATTLVSATQVTAAIPAADVSSAGTVNVTVVNPAPGGGATPTSIAFTVDGFALAGPGSAATVKAGMTATIPITITPTANGFSNPVTFSVTGLPAHATLVPLNVTPGNAKSTANVMITTTARSAAPPASPMDQPLTPMLRMLLVTWIAALLAGLYAARLIRRTPRLRRYAAIVPLALLLISGAVLAGCASAMKGTPAGTSQLTVTATSGTLSQSTPATLTVQ